MNDTLHSNTLTLWEGLDNIHKAGVSRQTYLLFREVIHQLTNKQIEEATAKAAARYQEETQ